MFLQQLHLENLRSLSDVELNFCHEDGSTRPWTLLLGENGCGKSTVLRAVALLLSGTDAIPELLGQPDSWIRNGALSCKISARLVTQKGETRDIDLSFRRGQNISQILMENSEGLHLLSEALGKSDTNYPLIGYGASRRPSGGRGSTRATEGYFSSRRANAVATLFAPDAPLNPLDTWAMDLHYREKAAGKKIVSDTLAQLLPNIEFLDIDRKAGTLIFNTPDGEVPLHQLSDGYQNMAGWCGDLLYRLVTTFGHRKSPLDTRGLLLVDEIDLHLHPVWQRQLRSFLSGKLKNFQIIATTHSPLTAQQSSEGEIYVLNRDLGAGKVTATHYAGAANLLSMQQVLTSPAFGLDTTLSMEMQSARKEWKATRKASARSLLQRQVRPMLIPPDSHTLKLLQDIEKELSGRKKTTKNTKTSK